MKASPLLLLAAAPLLVACSGPNVSGQVPTTGETFTGSTSAGLLGGMTGTGSIDLTSSTGAKCEGRTVSAAQVGSTVAVITCNDGRAGSVVLIDGPTQSVGTGVLGNDQVTLTIEK